MVKAHPVWVVAIVDATLVTAVEIVVAIAATETGKMNAEAGHLAETKDVALLRALVVGIVEAALVGSLAGSLSVVWGWFPWWRPWWFPWWRIRGGRPWWAVWFPWWRPRRFPRAEMTGVHSATEAVSVALGDGGGERRFGDGRTIAMVTGGLDGPSAGWIPHQPGQFL